MPNKFSLALGGGAARGLAHIGVIKYLEENNLKPSEVSGTSMGAIIASMYATGKTSSEMLEICSKINYFKLIDIDFKKGLIAGNKIKNFFKQFFGDLRIEDTDIPLTIVSTNINTGEKYVFKSGLIIDAIRSSLSIPGVIIPNKFKDVELVDGGIVNNLPIEVLSNDNVLAVSVLRDTSRQLTTKIKVLGFEVKHNIFGMSYQILQKSIDIMMKQNEDKSINCGKNVILLHPKFPKIDYFEFHKYKEISEIGYKDSQENNLAQKIKDKFIN